MSPVFELWRKKSVIAGNFSLLSRGLIFIINMRSDKEVRRNNVCQFSLDMVVEWFVVLLHILEVHFF
jgi:hypothetical protein